MLKAYTRILLFVFIVTLMAGCDIYFHGIEDKLDEGDKIFVQNEDGSVVEAISVAEPEEIPESEAEGIPESEAMPTSEDITISSLESDTKTVYFALETDPVGEFITDGAFNWVPEFERDIIANEVHLTFPDSHDWGKPTISPSSVKLKHIVMDEHSEQAFVILDVYGENEQKVNGRTHIYATSNMEVDFNDFDYDYPASGSSTATFYGKYELDDKIFIQEDLEDLTLREEYEEGVVAFLIDNYDFEYFDLELYSGEKKTENLIGTVDVFLKPLWEEEASISATNITHTSATISWSEINNISGIIHEGYKIFVDGNEVHEISSTDLHDFEITKLIPGKTYTVEVKTIFNNGKVSEESLSAEIVTPSLWPDTAELTASSIRSSSLILEWTEVMEGISYKIYKDNEFLIQVNEGNKYTVTNLSPNTSYTFKVEAIIEEDIETEDGPTKTVTTNSVSNSDGGSGSGGSSTTTPSNSTEINASNGGTVTREGVEIIFPANVFDETFAVKVEKVTNLKEEWQPKDKKLVSDIFEITKDKIKNFNKAVTITLPFHRDNIDRTKYEVAVYWLNEDNGNWIILDNITIDWSNGKVSGEVDHFTKFTVLATEKQTEVLSDIKGNWAEDHIYKLVELGAVTGYQDGTFKPNNTITRAEFIAIVVRVLGLELQTGKIFTDTKDHWAKDIIATAHNKGIIQGYNDTTFGVNDLITREQMAMIIVNAFEFQQGQGKSFNDSELISPWAKDAIQKASSNGIITGYQDGTFKPKNHATRAEAVTVIVKALEKD